MKKFATDIISSDILTLAEHMNVGKVRDIIIDPESGSCLGLGLLFQKKEMVIPINELRSFGPSLVIVNSIDSISEPEDIARIQAALALNAKIIGEKVETESGQKLGKASNYSVDLKYLQLDKLYVTPRLGVNFLSSELIIAAKNIIEIQKKKIIVTDAYAKSKKPAVSVVTSPAID